MFTVAARGCITHLMEPPPGVFTGREPRAGWVRIRRNTQMPGNHELIEVRLATGQIQRGRAGDFLWNTAPDMPGRIVAFCRMG